MAELQSEPQFPNTFGSLFRVRDLNNSVRKTSSVEFAFCGRILPSRWKSVFEEMNLPRSNFNIFTDSWEANPSPFGFYFSMNSFIEILTLPKPCPNITGWRKGLSIHSAAAPLILEPLNWGQEAMNSLRKWWPLSPELQWLCALFYKIGLLFVSRKFIISTVIILAYSNVSM